MVDFDCKWDGELWRGIPSAPDYKASETGRIARFAPAKTRTVPYLLPASISGRAYAKAKLTIDSQKKMVAIHRIVCEAWNGPQPIGLDHCCHCNGDPTDNRPGNLRWDTCKGNLADRKKHGTEMIGDRNGRSRLTWEQVREMRNECSGEYGDFSRLERKYGIANSQVHEIIKRKSWWPEPEAAR